MVVADNWWIIAKSPEELQRMPNIWFPRCFFSGWDVAHAECTWSTTLSDHERRWQLNVKGHIIARRSRDDGIKVLGSIVSFSGSMDCETAARISNAWGAFYANKSTLCCFSVPLGKRLKLLQSVFELSLF